MNNHKIRTLLKSIRRSLGDHIEINKWTHSSRKELEGLCGISSYLLFKTFKRLGYRPTFCMNNRHCFLKINDYYIDLTLKQFGYRYPYVSIRKTPFKIQEVSEIAKTDKKIKRLFKQWDNTQNPFKQRLPKIVIDN